MSKRKSYGKVARITLGMMFAVSLPLMAQADDGDSTSGPSVKEAAKEVGHGVKDGAVAVGHGVKEGAVAVGHAAKDGVHAVGKGARKVGHAISDAYHDVKDDLTGKSDTHE